MGSLASVMAVRSEAYSFSWYDVWATVREVLIIVFAALVANVNLVEAQIMLWGISDLGVALIIFVLVELGRRFAKDNT